MTSQLTTVLDRAARIRSLISRELNNSGASELRLLRLRRVLLLLERRMRETLQLHSREMMAVPVRVSLSHQPAHHHR
jgi:hypothetical protein